MKSLKPSGKNEERGLPAFNGEINTKTENFVKEPLITPTSVPAATGNEKVAGPQ